MGGVATWVIAEAAELIDIAADAATVDVVEVVASINEAEAKGDGNEEHDADVDDEIELEIELEIGTISQSSPLASATARVFSVFSH